MERYDAVVVGAGPGGLTCAAILARRGLAVMVVDRNPSPGGTARTFSRDGFGFPCGPLGFTRPEIMPLAIGGAGSRSEFRRAGYRVSAFGRSFVISRSFPELARDLGARFPADASGISRFFNDSEAVAAELDLAALWRDPDLGGLGGLSAGSYVEGCFSDPVLRRLLGSMGACAPSSGFPMLASAWEVMSRRGIWYPRRGFSALAAGALERLPPGSVELRLASTVSSILVEDGRAVGVRLLDGSVVEAGRVVSNADFKTTFLELVDEADQPPEWRRAVEASALSPSVLQVSLGLEKAGLDLRAFDGATRIIYRRGDSPAEVAGPDWSADELDPGSLAGGELEITLWSGDGPDLAPSKCAVIVIRVSADHRHFLRFRPAAGGRTSGYAAYKKRLADALVEECERVVPGLRRSTKVMDVATPLTFEEKGGRWSGAAAGWSRRFEDSQDNRVRSLVLTPVTGLYMAGVQAFSWLHFGGVPTAVLSGAMAAAAARNLQPPVRAPALPGSGPLN